MNKAILMTVSAMMLLSAIPMAAGTVAVESGRNTNMDEQELSTLQGSLTAPSDLAPLEIAKKFLDENWNLFTSDKSDIDNLRVLQIKESLTANHVRFYQTYAGYGVMDSQISVHILKDGVVQMVHNELKDVKNAATEPAISGDVAVSIAKLDIGFIEALAYAEEFSGLAVVPDNGGTLVWVVFAPAISPLGAWMVYVDAVTGAIIEKKDVARYLDIPGTVFPTNPLVLSKDPKFRDNQFGIDDPVFEPMYKEVTIKEVDGTLVAAGFLSGPYVNILDKFEYAVDGAINFDYTRQDPRFEGVETYWAIDESQRYIQSLGFMESFNKPMAVGVRAMPGVINGMCVHVGAAAALLGLPEPPITELLLLGWHGTATTLPGVPLIGDCQMFGFVDLAEDPEGTLHEYGHAVLGDAGFTSGTAEGGAIHEGFADWWGNICLANNSGGFGDCYVGEWFASYICPQDNETTPPYLRKMISNKTVEDMIGEVHADGEIWSSPLFEMWQEMGRENATKLVLESMQFYPSAGGFTDCASGILQADMNLNNGSHGYFLKKTFDKRNITDYTIPDGMSILPPVVETEKQQSIEAEKKTPGFEFTALVGIVALAMFFLSRKKR
ncbi:MAG: M36 family metallopeptidase [Candidatus Thermoplasmatota archaeon]|nr:M36 family metallopeptidase [Candidatus Thermoplasmatota archaeon]